MILKYLAPYHVFNSVFCLEFLVVPFKKLAIWDVISIDSWMVCNEWRLASLLLPPDSEYRVAASAL